VDGSDFFAVYEAAGRAFSRARDGGGPSAIECTTTRFFGHFEGDPQRYRAKGEVEEHRQTMNCLTRFSERVLADGSVTQDELNAIHADVQRLIDGAVATALAAECPREADLYTDVYVSY
jgi:pyruvate dehydrogenase E1 component alpha subunit